ncbi:MAG: DegV family protein [Dehalococcoidales bacterium]|nr:MAG: DegV family protein [Dehalococcoidales bacterium]
MKKVAVVADSIACLPPELVSEYQLQIIPINIQYEGKTYRNGKDLTPSQAYQMLERAPDRFASSPASPGEYVRAFRKASEYGESVLCITLSSKLSTVYNMAQLAKEEARRDFPQIPVEVLDSMTAAGGEGLVVMAAARAAAEGKSMAVVTKLVKSLRDKVNVIGIMETVRYVYRTGRIPKMTSQVGSLLSIKPIFTITNGVVGIAGFTRSKERAVKRALKMMKDRVGTRPVHVAVSHADVLEEGQKLMEQISARFNCAELWLSDFSPVMGYATGTGVLAVAFYVEE